MRSEPVTTALVQMYAIHAHVNAHSDLRWINDCTLAPRARHHTSLEVELTPCSLLPHMSQAPHTYRGVEEAPVRTCAPTTATLSRVRPPRSWQYK